MRTGPVISTLDWPDTPEDLAARWPVDRPLLWLHSGRVHERWARWSIMASPRALWRVGGEGLDGSRWVGEIPAELSEVRFSHDPLRNLDSILRATAISERPSLARNLPFHGGWIGFISYDLGRVIEPRAVIRPHQPHANDWPLIELAWCPDALVFDHVQRVWFSIAHDARDNRVATRPWENMHRGAPVTAPGSRSDPAIGALRADINRHEYESMVARTIDLIAAGDIFQANIAQRFTAGFDGSARDLASAAFDRAQPWYGAFLETAGFARSLLSISPELFMHVDPVSRQVTTRPIKGTRPASCDPRELRDSIKDQAELNMIVDLMRNDLGRVCTYGSVRAERPRAIETHPTVHHGVAEIVGTLRPDVSAGDLLRATFPPGSVTGAPKIRAMQVIDELETAALGLRGPYCGAVGFFSDCGAITLNVAIRTLMLERGRAAYWAGAGIVADSIPAREWQETLDKTAAVRDLCAPEIVVQRAAVGEGAPLRR